MRTVITGGLTALAVMAAVAGGSAMADLTASGNGTTPKRPRVEFAYFGGTPTGGLVVGVRRPGRSRLAVRGSFTGIPDAVPGKRYLIAATTRPCSRQIAGDFNADGDVDGADFLVWRTSIIMANTEGDFHFRSSPRLQRARARTRSVRILDRDEGGDLRERDCAKATSIRGAAPRPAGAVAAHNRAFANSVSLREATPLAPGLDRYSGRVRSRHPRCRRRREVQVYRADVNPEVRLFSTRTSRRGRWLKKGPAVPAGAEVYALIETKVLRSSAAHDHICPVDRSPVRTTPYP